MPSASIRQQSTRAISGKIILSEQTENTVFKIFILKLSLFRKYFKYTHKEYRILYCAEFYGIVLNKILPVSLPYIFRLH